MRASLYPFSFKKISAATLSCLALFFIVLIVKAHAVDLIRSEPENGSILSKSPATVKAWFSEEVDAESSTIQVFNDAGSQVDNGDGGVDLTDPDHASMKVTLPQLGQGAYTVRWFVVLLDGDATEGAFSFFVGDEAAAAAAGYSAASDEVLGYQPGEDISDNTRVVWWIVGGAVLIGLVTAVVVLRQKPKPQQG